jgi:hypothetical protein
MCSETVHSLSECESMKYAICDSAQRNYSGIKQSLNMLSGTHHSLAVEQMYNGASQSLSAHKELSNL